MPQRIRYPLYVFSHTYIEIEESELCVYVQFIVSSLHYMIAIVTLLAMVFLNHSFVWGGGGGGGVKREYPTISETIYGHDFKHGKYEILLCRVLANYVQLLVKNIFCITNLYRLFRNELVQLLLKIHISYHFTGR